VFGGQGCGNAAAGTGEEFVMWVLALLLAQAPDRELERFLLWRADDVQKEAVPLMPKVDEERARALGVVFDYDERPILVQRTCPTYSKDTVGSAKERTVLVEIVVDALGRVSKARVLKSVQGLDASALNCVKGWSFKPATKAGRPVATLAYVPMVFPKTNAPMGQE
jgi:TonB family protein